MIGGGGGPVERSMGSVVMYPIDWYQAAARVQNLSLCQTTVSLEGLTRITPSRLGQPPRSSHLVLTRNPGRAHVNHESPRRWSPRHHRRDRG